MVSLPNGGLSGDVSCKRSLENGFVPKYKPRKVSAMRDFPPGCGSNAMPISLKPDANGSSRDIILEANGFDNSGITNASLDNSVGNPKMGNGAVAEGVGISAMDVVAEADGVGTLDRVNLVEAEGVGNSEAISNMEAQNGVRAADRPCDLSGVKSSALANFAGSSCTRNSYIEIEGPSLEEDSTSTDVNELLDKLLKDMNDISHDIEKSMMDIGPKEIQQTERIECGGQDTADNTIDVERGESSMALARQVTVTATDALMNDFQLTGAGLHNLKTDSLDAVANAGVHVMSKELNEAESLVLLPDSGAPAVEPVPDVSGLDDTVILPVHSQSSRSLCKRSIDRESSTIRKDKYRRRRVSAVRDFPPHCGCNVPKPAGEKELDGSMNDCSNKTEKIDTEPATSVFRNGSEALDGVEKVHVRRATSETLNGDFERASIEETLVGTTATTALDDTSESSEKVAHLDFEECSRDQQGSILEIIELRQVVSLSRTITEAEAQKTAEDAGRSVGKEIVTYTPNRNENVGPQYPESVSRKELQVEVVHGLTAAEGRSGFLTFTEEKERDLCDELPLEISPVSMCDGTEIVVYSPVKCDDMQLSHVHSSVDEVVVHGLMAAPNCPWRKGKAVAKDSNGERSGEKRRKQNPIWRKDKAVARKSSPKVISSGGGPSLKKKPPHHLKTSKSPGASMRVDEEGYDDDENSPTDSLPSLKRQKFVVNLPPVIPYNPHHGDARNRVRETLRLFHTLCRKFIQKEEAKPEGERSTESGKKVKRVDLKAAEIIKEQGKEVNTEKHRLGALPGVEVGDEFQYRVELAIVGIHRPYQGGIDLIKHKGDWVASSIVASGGYDDDLGNADVINYTGSGGGIVGKNKKPEDQKLERGNLALKNSIAAKTPVRVVRGWKVKLVDPLDPKPKTITTYIYDGLYTVTDYRTEKVEPHGHLVFKFTLVRNPGQPELAWKELKKSAVSKTRPGECVADISGGKESLPICAVNTLDDEKPPRFSYISKMMYPNWFHPNPPEGCDCIGRCSESKKCRCAVRNGGEIPYNRNGLIVEAKPLVYECGPHCKCPPSCYNRVSQRGIRFKLEIFKTEWRGWGMRSVTSIPSGSFICEYAGELLEDKEAEQRISNDEYLFDIGHNYCDSSLRSEEQAISFEEDEEGGYTIDAAQYGNIGRFINHSCSPNLYAQNVIYDHDDKKMPHVMLFAAETIPPLQELTYHYNYTLDQVRDSDGNIKIKKCYCGTAECVGRMY